MNVQIGKITRLTDFGLGFVLEEGQGGEQYPFTFAQIEGYCGESLRELRKSMGFKIGSIVRFILGEDLKVESVRALEFCSITK